MEKLLDIVAKLREVVVPPVPVTKMGKKDLLEFILEDAKLLDRMRTFHDKRKAKAVQSLIHEDQEKKKKKVCRVGENQNILACRQSLSTTGSQPRRPNAAARTHQQGKSRTTTLAS